jgi:hypothetical protein
MQFDLRVDYPHSRLLFRYHQTRTSTLRTVKMGVLVRTGQYLVLSTILRPLILDHAVFLSLVAKGR